VDNFPVLGIKPKIDKRQWRLRLSGLVEKPLELDWLAFAQLPQIDITVDFHCVTRWSRLDLRWTGTPGAAIVALAKPLAQARFVTLHSADGYSADLPFSALVEPGTLFARRVDGKPLSIDHGGPVRAVVPSRYGWKSAKWVQAIEFLADDRPGSWETRGYHNDADPWKEERFG
jgi:DMSO/TMAO reductase YedYZ molybdopterin-dependent catalytic subunit